MHGKDVVLDDVAITYPNGFTAVQPTSLIVRAGEFFSILGPSGCGKTTILRAVSGFITPSRGRIAIGCEDMIGVGPNARPTALIFQSLALFPLMKVWENVAFGLEARGAPRRKRRERAMELLALVALEGQGDKYPSALSGGQRQRVAVARALAVEPAVLLLDEPLSALDLKLRQHMRAELRAIQQKTGITFIYITHDQGEALTMSDRIAVMNEGVVEQLGAADEIYAEPRTAFVASFVGETNVFRGQISETLDRNGTPVARIQTRFGAMTGRNVNGLGSGDAAMLFVRPERMQTVPGEATGNQDNRITARVDRRDLEGPFVNLFLKAGDKEIAVHLTNAGTAGRDLEREMRIGFDERDALVLADGPLAATGREMLENG